MTMLVFKLTTGKYIRLEALNRRHIDDLSEAAAVDPSLYRWTPCRKAATV